MARTVLEKAFPPDRIDEVFETRRRFRYARELLFSTVAEMILLVVPGPRPSLHAAARRSENLPVSLTALYDEVISGRAGLARKPFGKRPAARSAVRGASAARAGLIDLRPSSGRVDAFAEMRGRYGR